MDELVDLKCQAHTLWLKDCHSQPLQQALRDLETAFSNFFEKRAKYPRFKSRKRTTHSLRFPQNVTIINNHSVRIPKIGTVRANIHRPSQGLVKSATIKQDSTGRWWVIFVCHIERPLAKPTCNNPVGIDLGLENSTTFHTGEKVKPPKFYRQGEKRLQRVARKLSRAHKGSKRRQKIRKQLAQAHRRIANQRADWLHKQALRIIRQFDTICIEDLNVRGLVRTKPAKSFTDVAVSTFTQMLLDKAEWYGRQVIKVGRWFASSKQCHKCQMTTVLTLSERMWICSSCGMRHDRDMNAAINILHEGLNILAAGQSRG